MGTVVFAGKQSCLYGMLETGKIMSGSASVGTHVQIREGATSRRLLIHVNVGWFFVSHRLALAKAAMQAGYEVHVACGIESAAEQLAIERSGVRFHRLPSTRGSLSMVREILGFVLLCRAMARARPQVVHAITAKPIFLSGVVRRLYRVPVFVGALTGLGHLFTVPERRRLLRRLAVLALRVGLAGPSSSLILQNQLDCDVMTAARIVTRAKIVIVPGSGVDLLQFRVLPEPSGVPLVVLPARMLRDKGVVEFCEAADMIRRRGEPARFALVGGTDTRNPSSLTDTEVRALCAGQGVEYWGHRTDMAQVLSEATIVCLPSYREGLPKALIEAGACGRAIVATDVPGCNAVVQDNQTGLLVPARDANRLSEAILALLGNAELRARLGRNARRQAEDRFDVLSITKQTLQVYERLLATIGR